MRIGIEYYAFSLFLAALICLIAILCKVLFSNVKRQKKLLDEKETKLLQLYQTVESIIDEFNDQVKAATDEFKEHEQRAAAHAATVAASVAAIKTQEQQHQQLLQQQQPVAAKTESLGKLPRAERADPGRMRAANDALARAERIVKSNTLKNTGQPAKNDGGIVFQRLFDETMDSAPAETPVQQTRNEAILALSESGKTDAQIASELGITQNEVKLIIGLTRK